MSVLPVTQIAPGSFAAKRGANGRSTIAAALVGTTTPTRRTTATHCTTRRTDGRYTGGRRRMLLWRIRMVRGG